MSSDLPFQTAMVHAGTCDGLSNPETDCAPAQSAGSIPVGVMRTRCANRGEISTFRRLATLP